MSGFIVAKNEKTEQIKGHLRWAALFLGELRDGLTMVCYVMHLDSTMSLFVLMLSIQSFCATTLFPSSTTTTIFHHFLSDEQNNVIHMLCYPLSSLSSKDQYAKCFFNCCQGVLGKAGWDFVFRLRNVTILVPSSCWIPL